MPSLSHTLAALDTIAPLRASADWDNTGLLLEGTGTVARIGLCIDLTEGVLSEFVAASTDTIIAYHPPIFRGLKQLTSRRALDRVVLEVIRRGIHLYAPHTALDAAAHGMADWLLDAVGPTTERGPLVPAAHDPTIGVGRRGTLARPTPLRALVPTIKNALGLDHLRIAGDPECIVRTAAVCPGAGGSVLRGAPADLLLTGELGHHDVLAHVAAGGTVVLTDHTNCERGFLPTYARRIEAALPDTRVHISVHDADPLRVV